MKKVGNFLLLKMENVQRTARVSVSSSGLSASSEGPESDFSASSCILVMFMFIFFKLHLRH